ncbi:hypothetical protein GCM10010967_50160 [Dyadobacter beijingensis]|uniref:Outer membrane protein beta-barrel domain-containing protein n=1 Tax=Dyadobacter beijingensis TaxID=365489 RepID=A0ABQ2IGI8_9BACT|nr:hypothetical protein [Dyadobacter beijingensis]GGN08472.1 hypothetical protein GCM10010967_50160 [Dyadobacter beijingensis]
MKGIVILILILVAGTANAQTANKMKFVNHTEFGGLFGRVKFQNPYSNNEQIVDSKTSLTVQTFNGIQLNRRLSAGVTLGMDWYKAALLNPIAAGLRYDLCGRKNVQLYGSVDAGYAFTWFHDDSEGFDTDGGLMLNPGIGMKVGKPGAAAFTISLTYKRQEAHVTKTPLWDQRERYEDRVYNRLALRLGISF